MNNRSDDLGIHFKKIEALFEDRLPIRYYVDDSGDKYDDTGDVELFDYLKGIGGIDGNGQFITDALVDEDPSEVDRWVTETLSYVQFPIHEVSSPYLIVRVDGRAFHTLVKELGVKRPLSLEFAENMWDVAGACFTALQGCLLAYVQSDEISLVYSTVDGSWPFNGRTQKILTVLASTASSTFSQNLLAVLNDDRKTSSAMRRIAFDARLMLLDSLKEVEGYLLWRRLDAMRNAVNAYALHRFTESELDGKSTGERWQMLDDYSRSIGEDGFKIDDRIYRGAVVFLEEHEDMVSGEHGTVNIVRRQICTEAATSDLVHEVLLDGMHS